MTQYATMHKTICLDKATDGDGNPAPVTFTVRQIPNGREWWQQGTISHSRDCSTIQEAIGRLHFLFGLEMDERGYELRMEGESLGCSGNDSYTPDYFTGESGWYDLNNESGCPAYSLEDYPLDAQEWVTRGITSYAYDNYSLRIVASSGNIVY